MNTDDYLLGMSDCKEGRPAREGMSQDYYDGYETQAMHEENMAIIDAWEERERAFL